MWLYFLMREGVCMIGRSLDEVVIGCAIEVHRHLGLVYWNLVMSVV